MFSHSEIDYILIHPFPQVICKTPGRRVDFKMDVHLTGLKNTLKTPKKPLTCTNAFITSMWVSRCLYSRPVGDFLRIFLQATPLFTFLWCYSLICSVYAFLGFISCLWWVSTHPMLCFTHMHLKALYEACRGDYGVSHYVRLCPTVWDKP